MYLLRSLLLEAVGEIVMLLVCKKRQSVLSVVCVTYS